MPTIKEFDHWSAGELPDNPPESAAIDEFDHWSAGELPPVFGCFADEAATTAVGAVALAGLSGLSGLYGG